MSTKLNINAIENGSITTDKLADDVLSRVKSAITASELNDLIEDIEDNEFVTATALNQINASAGFTEGGISRLPDQQSLTDAIIDLQENKIGKGDVVDSARTAGIAASINVNDFYNIGTTYPLAILQNSNTGDTSMKTGQLDVAYSNGIKVDYDNSLVSDNGFKGNLYGLAKSATTSVSAQTSNVTKEVDIINHNSTSLGVYLALVENSYTGDTDYAGSRCIAQDTNLLYQDGVIHGIILSATTSVNANYIKINEPDWYTRINGCLPVLQSEYTGGTPGPNETCYMTVDTGITVRDGQINATQISATNVRASKIITTDSNLEFTDSSENIRMTLSNSGNLDVTGNISCSVLSGTGKYYLIGGGFGSSTSSKATLMSNSNVYMENGNLYASSDKTLKTHIDNVDGDLEKIKRIPKTIFHWNDDDNKKRQLGTYAQDVEEVYPEIVTKDDNGIRGVAYDRMGVIALAGIDKLYELVQQLQATNKELEKRIKDLENKN